MWTEAHRARHEAGLKHLLSLQAVGQIAAWLKRADPPRSGRATPSVAVVAGIWWHLRVGGPWRSSPPGYPPWRTVYGWFRRWQERRWVVERSLGAFTDRGGLLRDRAGRLDVSAARIACVALMAAVKAINNPKTVKEQPA